MKNKGRLDLTTTECRGDNLLFVGVLLVLFICCVHACQGGTTIKENSYIAKAQPKLIAKQQKGTESTKPLLASKTM